MNLFNERIQFSKIDPLGDGLREQIAAEQDEPQAITLEEGIDGDMLHAYWESIQSDDPVQFDTAVED